MQDFAARSRRTGASPEQPRASVSAQSGEESGSAHRTRLKVGLLALVSSAVLLPAPGQVWLAATSVEANADARELRFRVLLDDREIGFHRYELRQDGDTRVVRSRAEFDVKFLFFNAYSYRHSLTARWDGSCLESLETRTNANGKRTTVSGLKSMDGFVVERGETVDELPSCVMNFAYWDPRILEQRRLLNPQTGEYLDVTVRPLGDATVSVGGQTFEADAYRITARDMRIDLWYRKDDQRWLALESLARGGRTIRYELT